MKTIVGLFAIVFFLSCQKSTDQQPRTGPSSLSWLALGDSYTMGQGLDPQDRLPAQTIALLKPRGIVVNKLSLVAAHGWTSADLLKALSLTGKMNYDVVTLMIGVNDQYLSLDTSVYSKNFTALLEYTLDVTMGNSTDVFVISIPDYSVTPAEKGSDTARIRKEIDMFNSINLRLSKEFNCSYVDITPLSKEARVNPNLISGDGLHPSALGYKDWARVMAAAISKTPW